MSCFRRSAIPVQWTKWISTQMCGVGEGQQYGTVARSLDSSRPSDSTGSGSRTIYFTEGIICAPRLDSLQWARTDCSQTFQDYLCTKPERFISGTDRVGSLFAHNFTSHEGLSVRETWRIYNLAHTVC